MSEWMIAALPFLGDLAALGLALLGAFVAVFPPREGNRRLKVTYVVGFILLFVLGMWANERQRTIESNKREKLEQDQRDASKRFSDDLRSVKGTDDAILGLVTHPPQGMTVDQAIQLAGRFLQKQQAAPSPVGPAKLYDDFTNSELVSLAGKTANDLDNCMGTWLAQVKETEAREDWQVYQHTPPLSEAERAVWEREFQDDTKRKDNKYGSEARVLIARADGLREAMTSRLVKNGSSLSSSDEKAKALIQRFSEIGEGGAYQRQVFDISAYLRELCQRLG